MRDQKIALYRQYRPESLDMIVGQEHIVRIIKNALKENKVSHAYLFSGPRGTGKTSVARILARSLNCEKRSKYDPCGKCNTCRNIKDGSMMDVVEIDAASNRGIDEIRELREKIKFSPTEGRYKVFIIDEVHMLTKEAFNALLKTLEEPPEHAFFVLATTELNKVPSTIISRCQRHDFRRIKMNDIINKLLEISKSEKITISEEGIGLIAEVSDGGLRDALSILDQLASTGAKKITTDEIVDLIGITPQQKVYDYVKSLISKDSKKTLQIISELESSNHDLITFTRSVKDLISKILLVKVGGADYVEGTKEQVEAVQELALLKELNFFVSLSKKIIAMQKSFKTGADPAFVLSVFSLAVTAGNKASKKEISGKVLPFQKEMESKDKKAPSEIVGKKDAGTSGKANGQWHHFLLEIKSKNNALHAFLRVANPVFSEDMVTLYFPYKFHKEKMEETKNKLIVEEVIEKTYGQKYKVRCILDGNGGNGRALVDSSNSVAILGGELVED